MALSEEQILKTKSAQNELNEIQPLIADVIKEELNTLKFEVALPEEQIFKTKPIKEELTTAIVEMALSKEQILKTKSVQDELINKQPKTAATIEKQLVKQPLFAAIS